MPNIRPFKNYNPNPEMISSLVSQPYDVVNREEVRAILKNNPSSFLSITRSDGALEDNVDAYSQEVYDLAKQTFKEFRSRGFYKKEEKPKFYIYGQTSNTHTQYGLVASSSVEDYHQDIIKKHEKTRAKKEADRTKHIDELQANTEPVFLTYKANSKIDTIVSKIINTSDPVISVKSDGDIHNKVWPIDDESTQNEIVNIFKTIDASYIADGHHRAASAASVGKQKQKENPNRSGDEEFNYFLSILFPSDQLEILPYNRVIKGLGNYTSETLLKALEDNFIITEIKDPVEPSENKSFTCYLDNKWYILKLKPEILIPTDVVKSLDVSLLQNYILEPLLAIQDPRTDPRIDFVGGIKGLKELKRRVDGDMDIAFSLYPTSIQNLIDVADAGLLMPPKSTWFEPKLVSGLFIHDLIN